MRIRDFILRVKTLERNEIAGRARGSCRENAVSTVATENHRRRKACWKSTRARRSRGSALNYPTEVSKLGRKNLEIEGERQAADTGAMNGGAVSTPEVDEENRGGALL